MSVYFRAVTFAIFFTAAGMSSVTLLADDEFKAILDTAEAMPDYDLTPTQVVPDLRGVRLFEDKDATVLLTGIPKLDRKTQKISFLAVSPINPVELPAGDPSRIFFGDALASPPRTWKSAKAACESYNALGKTWTLPDLIELSQLNMHANFYGQVLDPNKPEGAVLRKNFAFPKDKMHPQFTFFWASDPAPSGQEGLRMAAFFGPNAKKQSMSEARPLSWICVTYLSGPAREFDKMAMQPLKKKDETGISKVAPGQAAPPEGKSDTASSDQSNSAKGG